MTMEDIEHELNLSGIDRLLGVGWRDRCDYCGWPLAGSMEKGCVADNCSQRPRPLAMTSEAAQDFRRMESDLARLRARVESLEADLDVAKRQLVETTDNNQSLRMALELERQQVNRLQRAALPDAGGAR